MWQLHERRPRPPSLLLRLGILSIVPRPLGAGDELHPGDGDALDRGIGSGDGPPDGHAEVVVQLGSCLRAGDGDDVSHYGKVVVALKETIRLMAGIYEVIPSWPIE